MAAQSGAQEIKASAEQQGERIVVNLSTRVQASLADTWAVLVDYDHMAGFVSNLQTSRILRRHGNQLDVEQSGQSKVGMFSFDFASVRRIELVPMNEIRAHLVSGDFTVFETKTHLVEDGPATAITYHAEFIPKAWIPPLLGPKMIASETKILYGQLIAEVLRRAAERADKRTPAAPRTSP